MVMIVPFNLKEENLSSPLRTTSKPTSSSFTNVQMEDSTTTPSGSDQGKLSSENTTAKGAISMEVDAKTNKYTYISPPEAMSFTFTKDGLVSRITSGAVLDREVGNTGGLGGYMGVRAAIGKPLLPIYTKPFQFHQIDDYEKAIPLFSKAVVKPIRKVQGKLKDWKDKRNNKKQKTEIDMKTHLADTGIDNQ